MFNHLLPQFPAALAFSCTPKAAAMPWPCRTPWYLQLHTPLPSKAPVGAAPLSLL